MRAKDGASAAKYFSLSDSPATAACHLEIIQKLLHFPDLVLNEMNQGEAANAKDKNNYPLLTVVKGMHGGKARYEGGNHFQVFHLSICLKLFIERKIPLTPLHRNGRTGKP